VPRTYQVALDLIKSKPGQKVGIVELSYHLAEQRVLGCGVEAIDIVNDLIAWGHVEYDEDNRIVSIAPQISYFKYY
jgi:hypothetical protein